MRPVIGVRAVLLLSVTTVACQAATVGAGSKGQGDSGSNGGQTRVIDRPGCVQSVDRGLGMPAAAWERVGPPGAHVLSLLALGGNVILAGTGGRPAGGAGIYRSTDGGATFALVAQFSKTSVRSLVRVPSTSRIYAGVGGLDSSSDDGVYLSDDNGLTFTSDNAGIAPTTLRVRSLSVAAGATERVYLMIEGDLSCPGCARTSLYRRDAGGPWAEVAFNGVDESTGGPALAMAADVSDSNKLYVANGERFNTSLDGGANFTATSFGSTVFPPNGAGRVRQLHTDSSDPQHIAVSTYDAGAIATVNGGAIWSASSTALAFTGVFDIHFSATRTLVATGGVGLQSGASLTLLSEIGSCLVEPVITAVSVAPDDANLIVAGTYGGGVHRSTDAGVSFFPPSSGIDEPFGRLRVTSAGGVESLWLMGAGGLFRSDDLGNRWSRADLPGFCFSDIAVDPSDSTRFLVATLEDLSPGCASAVGLLVSSPSSLITAAGFTGRNVAAVEFDPTETSRVFAYQKRGKLERTATPLPRTGILVSTDSGMAFAHTTMRGEATSHFASSVLAVSSSATLFAGFFAAPPGPGVFTELWRSQDSGATFGSVWNGGTLGSWSPTGVFVASDDAIYMSGWNNNESILRSSDGGTTFVSHGTGLTSFAIFVNDLAFSPNGGLLVATEEGVFYAADGSAFVALNTGLPAGSVANDVAVIAGTPATAFVVTEASGIYRIQLP